MPIAPPPEFTQPVDVANMASKLPRPLQQPVGTALGALKQFAGGDDANSQLMSSLTPMMGNVVWGADAAKTAAPEASGALQALWNTAKSRFAPAAETLGENTAELTPSGGEGLYNMAKAGLKRLADPAEAAYHRILQSLPTSR